MKAKSHDLNCHSATESRGGFTCVELLVSIGMLALLASIQVSAMANARGRTKAVMCADNVRQITMSLHLYGSDHNDKLPVMASGVWAWDMPSSVTYRLLSYGLQKRTFYCPSTAPQYTDKENYLNPYPSSLWSFAFPPNASEGDPNYFHITGYVFTFGGAGSKLNLRYQNTKITAESHLTGAATFYDSPASRVLVADVIISTSSTYPASANQPFQGIAGGFFKPHLSAHLVGGAVPNGANLGYKDGHVQWKKFNSPPAGFFVPSTSPWLITEDTHTMVRTTSNPYFWW